MQDNNFTHFETMVDKMIEKREDRKKQPDLSEKHKKEFTDACAALFDSPEGYVFLKTLVDFMGILKHNNNMNGVNLITEKAHRNLYYGIIRPYLPKNVIRKVEG